MHLSVGSAFRAGSLFANKTGPDRAGEEHFFCNGLVTRLASTASECEYLTLIRRKRVNFDYALFSEILRAIISLVNGNELRRRDSVSIVWQAGFLGRFRLSFPEHSL